MSISMIGVTGRLRISLCAAGALAALGFGAASGAHAEMSFVRLSPGQYERTIHSIFGPSIDVEAAGVDSGFRDNGLLAVGDRKLTVSSASLERYETVARNVVGQVLSPRNEATFLPCAPKSKSAPDDACVRQVVNQLAPLLFRRPLRDAEAEPFVATARSATEKTEDFHTGLSFAMIELLVSPEFLLRVERSEPDPEHPGLQRLDAYSMASRLSFFLWDSAPDKLLMAAAASGKLNTEKGLAQEVERLLSSPRAEYGMRAYFSDMFAFADFATLSKNTNLFPKFTKHVEDDAREQTLRTVVDQLFMKDGDYRDLYTTRRTFLTPQLAALYDVPLPRSQELGGAVPWIPYEFPESDPRVGILTHVSFLALHSHPGTTSPTLRGKAIRENILCQKVPPPPGNIDFTVLQDASNPSLRTVRQRLTAHRATPVCAGCHKITDPIGLSMETFDSSGVARTHENGADIDTTGDLGGKKFDAVPQLMALMRNEPALSKCLVTRTFSYGTARTPTPDDTKWLNTVNDDLAKNGVKWRPLMRQIATNPRFYAVPVNDMKTAQAR
ncbi:MAG: DUF1592 domain-containing protein [Gammaproteobacteria bacterium]